MLPNPEYHRRPPFDAALRAVDDATRAQAWKAFEPEFSRRRKAWAEAPKRDFAAILPGAAGERLKDLQRDGVTALRLDPRHKSAMTGLTRPVIATVRAHSAVPRAKVKFADAAAELAASEHCELHAVVNAALEQSGALAIATAYSAAPLRMKSLFAQVNDVERTRAKFGEIDDDGLPKVKSAYWHVDSSIYPSAKILIYLNEVGPEQGPFRYVRGTHVAMSDSEAVIRKTNDALKLHPRLFMALPEEYRMHTLIGDYLDPDAGCIADFLARERAITSEDGDLALFDNHGVHRGGFVRSGSREILQILFAPAGANAVRAA